MIPEGGGMGDMTTIGENVDFNEILTTGAVSKLIHRSDETVRQLADRPWHPLPYINTGMGKKKSRLFRRTSILKWLEEEESSHNEPASRLSVDSAVPKPGQAPSRAGRARPPKAAPAPAVLAAPPKTRAAAGGRP
jgi:hypothetical protein